MRLTQFVGICLLIVGSFNTNIYAVSDSIGLKKDNGNWYILHEVEQGETLYRISKRYNATVDAIKSANPFLMDYTISIGQVLQIPHANPSGLSATSATRGTAKTNTTQPSSSNSSKPANPAQSKEPANPFPGKLPYIHKVKQSEGLYGIAREYNVKVQEIIDWNILQEQMLNVGQQLTIYLDEHDERVKPKTPPPAIAKNDKPTTPTPTILEPDDHGFKTKPIEESGYVAPTPESIEKDKKSKKEDKDNNLESTDAPSKNMAAKEENAAPNDPLTKDYQERVGSAYYCEKQNNGTTAWIDDSMYPKKKGYFALHKDLPIGTLIKVTNTINNRWIVAKVIGGLPKNQESEKLSVKLPLSAAKKLRINDDKFYVQIDYLEPCTKTN